MIAFATNPKTVFGTPKIELGGSELRGDLLGLNLRIFERGIMLRHFLHDVINSYLECGKASDNLGADYYPDCDDDEQSLFKDFILKVNADIELKEFLEEYNGIDEFDDEELEARQQAVRGLIKMRIEEIINAAK
jgi:hypothetical protein